MIPFLCQNFSHLVLDIELAEDEFRSSEAYERMEVSVCKNRAIGSNVQVLIIPMTIDEAVLSGHIASTSLPPNQTFSPNRAGEIFADQLLILMHKCHVYIYRFE